MFWLMVMAVTADPCASLTDADVPLVETGDATFNLPAAIETNSPRLVFHLADGRICARLADRGGSWQLFGGTGLPSSTATVTEISADGRNLIALDEEGVIHYTKIHPINWTDKWLALPVVGAISRVFSDGRLRMPANRGWSVSHRGPENGYYEDIAGKRHPIGAGVTTLYYLSSTGDTLHYADPWLPNGFDNTIPMPEGGTFVADAMDASASVLFLLARAWVRDPNGEVVEANRMYTRLIDFDTEGNNPFLTYTYRRHHPDGGVRTLPAEDWRRQPPIILARAARLSSAIAIQQTGQGNSARQLRVEGLSADGDSGYYTKNIDDAAWKFIATHHVIPGERFLARLELGFVSSPPSTINCSQGTLASQPFLPWRDGVSFAARLSGFAPGQVGARVEVVAKERLVALPIYSHRRFAHLLGKKSPAFTLVTPDELAYGEDGEVRRIIDLVFNGDHSIDVSVEREGEALSIEAKGFGPSRFRFQFNGCGAGRATAR